MSGIQLRNLSILKIKRYEASICITLKEISVCIAAASIPRPIGDTPQALPSDELQLEQSVDQDKLVLLLQLDDKLGQLTAVWKLRL